MAHALKGVAGNLAILRVADLAATIEACLKSHQRDAAKSQLNALHESLLEVGIAIGKLHDPTENPQPSVKDFDAEVVKQLLCELMSALDELNPDVVEPVILKLADYVVKSDLEPIQMYVDAFDFEKAKSMAATLANKLSLSVE